MMEIHTSLFTIYVQNNYILYIRHVLLVINETRTKYLQYYENILKLILKILALIKIN